MKVNISAILSYEIPEPADILLTIEVAETSLQFDRRVKAPLYAAAGVPRLWIVDLDAGAIERVLRAPALALNRQYAQPVVAFSE